MTEFSSLIKAQQIEIVKSRGAFLFVRQQGVIDIILYQLDNFYVEVFFDADDSGTQIKCFDKTDALDVYLKEINISAVQELL